LPTGGVETVVTVVVLCSGSSFMRRRWSWRTIAPIGRGAWESALRSVIRPPAWI
jgi:hypothetical protein